MDYRTAPWLDFAGQPINHGDRLTHPDGAEFIAVRLNGFDDDGDDDLPDDERIERCAACGHIFDIEDELPEDDEYQSDVQAAAGGLTQVPIE